MSKTASEYLVEALEKTGVKRIYGVVGDSLNGITDALRRRKSIDWIHMRHEEAAAFAAGAEAHLTGDLAERSLFLRTCNSFSLIYLSVQGLQISHLLRVQGFPPSEQGCQIRHLLSERANGRARLGCLLRWWGKRFTHFSTPQKNNDVTRCRRSQFLVGSRKKSSLGK
jgi:Thiamine pyrophosphate enzyme, N-terminal TPP binding domain